MTSYDDWRTTDPNEGALTGSDAVDVLVPDFATMTWPQRLAELIESLPVDQQAGAWENAYLDICNIFDGELILAAEDALRSAVEAGEAAQCDA